MAKRWLSAEELVQHANLRPSEVNLPLRGGTKNEMPDGSWLQDKQLAFFLGERKAAISEERIRKQGALAVGEWKPELGKVHLVEKVGRFWKDMGHEEDGQKLLLREEALFLMDEGQLEISYGGLPWSLQEAYANLLGRELPIEHYQVFSHLARLGFIVRKFSGIGDATLYEHQIGLDKLRKKQEKKRKRKTAQPPSTTCGEECETGGKKPRTEGETVTIANEDSVTVMDKNMEISSAEPGSLADYSVNTDKDCAIERTCGELNSVTSHVEKQQLSCTADRENAFVAQGSDSTGDEQTLGYKKECPLPTTDACENSHVRTCQSASDLSTSLDLLEPEETTTSRSWYKNKVSSKAEDSEAKQENVYKTAQEEVQSLHFKVRWDFDALNFPNIAPSVNLEMKHCSDPSRVRVKRTLKQTARNWAEYKQRLKQQSEREQLQESVMGHLWRGDVQPLVSPLDAVSPEAVLDKLKIIQNIKPRDVKSSLRNDSDLCMQPIYDVYQPDAKFAKTRPGLPIFRVCVFRQDSSCGSLSDLARLWTQCPDAVPVNLAVVDHGDISFYSFNAVDLPRDV